MEQQTKPVRQISERSYAATLLFAFFLGWCGAHRFYVGKTGTAVLMIFTLGGLGIWSLVDTILVAVGEFKDNEGKYIHW